MKNVLQLEIEIRIIRRIKMYSTAISRGSKITSALSSLSLKPGNGNFWGGRPRFCGKIRDQIAFSCPVSHRFGSWWRCRRERLCLRRRWRWSWCHDRGVGTREHLVRFPANLLPGASRLGTLSRWHLPAGGEVIVEEGDGHRQDDQVGDQ